MTDIIATAEDVKAAYRLILGREPDSGGLADYSAIVAKGDLTTSQLRATFMRSPEYASNRERLVDIGGATLVVDASEPEFGRHIARDSTWEPHIVAIIRNNLHPGQVFVDIGANVGVMSLYAAMAVGPTGKVISFEPDEDNARFFLRGVFESKFQDFVRLHRFALSDRQAIFSLTGGSNANLTPASAGGRMVQAIRGDDLLFQEPRVDVIKLDIEGFEPLALAGLERTIAKNKPYILSEFNPRCLTTVSKVPPLQFAEQIFAMTPAATVIQHDGRTNSVTTPTGLVTLWNEKNAEASRTGFLPAGMLHFDVLFRANRGFN
jgi:FkbM family methyltransferase